jgi:hypothetical protein
MLGAVRMWARPGDWPEVACGQTRRVLAAALFTEVTAAGLLMRAAGPPRYLAPDPTHLTASAWLVPIVAGVALAVPLPPFKLGALGRVAAIPARTMAAPTLALLTLYLVAHSGLTEHPGGAGGLLLLAYYWAVLGFVGLRACTLVTRAGRIAVVPGARRLRLALLLVGAGLAAAACQCLASYAQGPAHAGSLALCASLSVLAAAAVSGGRDLRAGSPSEPPASASR